LRNGTGNCNRSLRYAAARAICTLVHPPWLDAAPASARTTSEGASESPHAVDSANRRGINVRDALFADVFDRLNFTTHMLGENRLYAFAAKSVSS